VDRDATPRTKLPLPHRIGRWQVRRKAGKRKGEPLSAEDWAAWAQLDEIAMNRALHRFWRMLPSGPRCGICTAPFGNPGRWIVRPFGFGPSRKNPTLCAACVESSPPGGMNTYAGILFADLRGFTARFEGADPEEASKLLRRFYRCAEDVLFPDAVIDKLIGDEVMALYLPILKKRTMGPADVPGVMLDHARGLLEAVGYGSGDGPFVEMGIGLDVGEAFVGNIGHRAVYDFTAVGDVVNTASRLQAQAGGGEIVYSDRVASGLPTSAGTRVELQLKGKSDPQVAYRVSI
jgi:adenylate cyclase